MSSKHAEIGQSSFGIFVCRSVGTVPGILGLVWPSFRPNSGSKSKISDRILKRFRGPFSSAEQCTHMHARIKTRWPSGRCFALKTTALLGHSEGAQPALHPDFENQRPSRLCFLSIWGVSAHIFYYFETTTTYNRGWGGFWGGRFPTEGPEGREPQKMRAIWGGRPSGIRSWCKVPGPL